jgi:hypothetical protein
MTSTTGDVIVKFLNWLKGTIRENANIAWRKPWFGVKNVKQSHDIVVFQHMKTEDLIWWLVGSPQS